MSQVETQRFPSEGARPGSGVDRLGHWQGTWLLKRRRGGRRAERLVPAPDSPFRQALLPTERRDGERQAACAGGPHHGAGSMGVQRSVPRSEAPLPGLCCCDHTPLPWLGNWGRREVRDPLPSIQHCRAVSRPLVGQVRPLVWGVALL